MNDYYRFFNKHHVPLLFYTNDRVYLCLSRRRKHQVQPMVSVGFLLLVQIQYSRFQKTRKTVKNFSVSNETTIMLVLDIMEEPKFHFF